MITNILSVYFFDLAEGEDKRESGRKTDKQRQKETQN